MTDSKAGSPPKREPRSRPKRGGAEPKKPQQGDPAGDNWDQLSQREKFIRTARELGCDETGEPLDEALRSIGRARRRVASPRGR
jgi:hypothetical protein